MKGLKVFLWISSVVGALLIGVFSNAIWAFVQPLVNEVFPSTKEEKPSVFTERDSAINEIAARGLTLGPKLWETAFRNDDGRLIELLLIIEVPIDQKSHDKLWQYALDHKSKKLVTFLQSKNVSLKEDIFCKRKDHEDIVFLVDQGIYGNVKCEAGTLVDQIIANSIDEPKNEGEKTTYDLPEWIKNVNYYRANPGVVSLEARYLGKYSDYVEYAQSKIAAAARDKSVYNECLKPPTESGIVVFDGADYSGGYYPAERRFGNKMAYTAATRVSVRTSGGMLDILQRRAVYDPSIACDRPSKVEHPTSCSQVCIERDGRSIFDPKASPSNCRLSERTDSKSYLATLYCTGTRLNCRNGDCKDEKYTFWFDCEQYAPAVREKYCRATFDKFKSDAAALNAYGDYIERLKDALAKAKAS